jgi:hypothetical protein
MNDGELRAPTRKPAVYRVATAEVYRGLNVAAFDSLSVLPEQWIATRSTSTAQFGPPPKNTMSEHFAALLDFREVAAQRRYFADVHGLFCKVMEKAKRFGPAPRRRHRWRPPAANGHLIIAYAFLKAL